MAWFIHGKARSCARGENNGVEWWSGSGIGLEPDVTGSCDGQVNAGLSPTSDRGRKELPAHQTLQSSQSQVGALWDVHRMRRGGSWDVSMFPAATIDGRLVFQPHCDRRSHLQPGTNTTTTTTTISSPFPSHSSRPHFVFILTSATLRNCPTGLVLFLSSVSGTSRSPGN